MTTRVIGTWPANGTSDTNFERNGAPGRIRTCGLKLRRLLLYPTELRARTHMK